MTRAAHALSSTTGRRMRLLHPLSESDESCRLLYDLERTFVIEVPRKFRGEIAAALSTGAFDAQLLQWLVEADLLTEEPWRTRAQGDAPFLPEITDVSLDMSGSCNMGCTYCFEDAIASRIGPMSDEIAAASLDFVFEKTAASSHIALHFGSGEPLIRFDLLKRIVCEANARATALGKTVAYDLTTNATLVTPDIAAFLRDNPFSVRVSCDGPASIHDRFRPMRGGQRSYAAVERGLRILLESMSDRLTVNTVICGETRLTEIWTWAKDLGLRHLHVIKVGAEEGRDISLRAAELAIFRADLEAICSDLLDCLREGRTPIDFQPITKVVRRLIIPQPITRFCGVAGSYLGVASDGQVYPCFRHLGLSDYRFGSVGEGIDNERRRSFLGREAADVDSRPVCQDCWARYLCGGGCYADSVVYGPDRRAPRLTHCPFWQTEIDVAIRFYDRLRLESPAYCLALFGDDIDAVLARSSGGANFLARRNCQ